MVCLCGNDPLNKTDPTGMFGYYPGFYELSVQFSNSAVTSTVIDFTPGVGDAKAIADAVANPSAINVAVAAVGILPGVGDAAAKAIKISHGAESAASAVKLEKQLALKHKWGSSPKVAALLLVSQPIKPNVLQHKLELMRGMFKK